METLKLSLPIVITISLVIAIVYGIIQFLRAVGFNINIKLFSESLVLKIFNWFKRKFSRKPKKITVKNKFMELTVQDFEKYLITIMVNLLARDIDLYIHAGDKNSMAQLQIRGFMSFTEHFSDINSLIEAYYGKNYMKNFYNLTFDRMRLQGEISALISRRGIK